MTEITKPARQMAADLANAERTRGSEWQPHHCDEGGNFDSMTALARLCDRTIDAKIARHELDNERDALLARMQEDMAEIHALTDAKGDATYSVLTCALAEIRTIAARYRVEADPLVAALEAAADSREHMDMAVLATKLRAELAKRGLELGAAK